ncbi:MAG: glycoside hydrolase family 127 protein, partial [Flavobacterium piscis]|nr:glycoside hydrolase family 127 protein [Flavobacterium piscis]
MKNLFRKYKIFCCLFGLWITSSATAQMQLFDLEEVRLKEGPFKNAQDVDLKYILELNPDRLLAPYLIASG